MPYAANAHVTGMGDGGAVGAAAGTAILGPGAGTVIGDLVGGLFGKKPAPQNPGGPAAFARWAREGHLDWVQSVARSMSGPNWQIDINDTGSPWKSGYSPADAASATQILAQYGLTPTSPLTTAGGVSMTSVRPPQVATQAVAPGAAAAGITAILSYMNQGFAIDQAVSMAVSSGQLSAAQAAPAKTAAQAVAGGTKTVTQAAADLTSGLLKNPLAIGALLVGAWLVTRGGRRSRR